MMSDPESTGHLHPDQVVAFVDDALSSEERDRILRHLSACDSCRREVSEVVGLVGPGRPRWRRTTVGLVAVAAGLVLLFPLLRGGPSQPDVVRGPGDQGTRTEITLLTPGADEQGESMPLRFSWRSLAEDLTYELTLSNDDGEVVWSTITNDTSVTPETSIRLKEGRYFWQVDALLRDGSWATSPLRSLSIR